MVVGIQYVFVLILAFKPELLSRSLSGGATTIGVPLAIGMIVIFFLLTCFYVYYTSQKVDPLVEAIRKEFKP
ncbi:Inner membrane protein YjcH [compost metagenome]